MVPFIIPQDYLAFISIFAAALSHFIRQLNMSKTQSAATSGLAIAFIIAVTAWMTGGFTPDLRADALLICSVAFSLLSGGKELVDLLNLLNGVQMRRQVRRQVRYPDPLASRQLPTVTRGNTLPLREQNGGPATHFISNEDEEPRP